LCFLKKSGNEKNTVSRIGEKIKRPAPGENSDPNDAVMMCDIGARGINPDISPNNGRLLCSNTPMREADASASGAKYLKAPSDGFVSL
tara:strand:+ start:161 stop:424 length:264 start_codon:yes stop_codon:yes gene_type:complete